MSSTGWSKFRKGIRFRLTLVYSALFGLCLCVFAYVITTQYFQTGREDFDASLLNLAIDLSEKVTEEKNLHLVVKVPDYEEKKAFPFILKKTYYAVRSIQGDLLSEGNEKFPFPEIPYNKLLPLKQDYTHRFLTFKHEGDIYRAVNLKITSDHKEDLILQVATQANSLYEREKNHLLMTAILVPAFIIFSGLIAFIIAGNALNPIKDLIDGANKIAAENLSLRVTVPDTADEVNDLANTLNNLLLRLEKAFQGQENFVANASHQLNTPLAIIKGELDVLESKPRSMEEHTKFLASLREEIERLIDLVKKMLLVSRVESGLEKQFVMGRVRLDDLLLTTTTRLQGKARDKQMTIRFNIDEEMAPAHLEVKGEKQLLDSLFENLLDNAIKYGPAESTVQIHISHDTGGTFVSIQDDGKGMKEEQFQAISQGRFQRVEGYGIPGSGIGLPVAKKIAELHGASLNFKNLSPKGSLFTVKFQN